MEVQVLSWAQIAGQNMNMFWPLLFVAQERTWRTVSGFPKGRNSRGRTNEFNYVRSKMIEPWEWPSPLLGTLFLFVVRKGLGHSRGSNNFILWSRITKYISSLRLKYTKCSRILQILSTHWIICFATLTNTLNESCEMGSVPFLTRLAVFCFGQAENIAAAGTAVRKQYYGLL